MVNYNNFKFRKYRRTTIVVCQLNGKRKYILGKLVFSCLVSIPFILFAVAYPIVTMRFEQHLSVSNILFRNIHSHSISAIRNCFYIIVKSYSRFISKVSLVSTGVDIFNFNFEDTSDTKFFNIKIYLMGLSTRE